MTKHKVADKKYQYPVGKVLSMNANITVFVRFLEKKIIVSYCFIFSFCFNCYLILKSSLKTCHEDDIRCFQVKVYLQN